MSTDLREELSSQELVSNEVSAAPERRSRARSVWLGVAVFSIIVLLIGGIVALGAMGEETAAPVTRNQAAPVTAVESVRTSLPIRLELRGELLADVAELSSQSTGYLVEVAVELGERVEKGQLLARVEPTQAEREVAQAQAQALAAAAAQKRAKAQLAAAEVEAERAERALTKGLISEQEAVSRRSQVDVLRAEVAATEAQRAEAHAGIALLKERLRDTEIVAPFDGAVAERYLDAGTMVQPGTAIVRLVKAGPLTVRFRVPERDLGRIAPGASFEVTTQASADERHGGTVKRIAAEVSRIDRTATVEGLLDETVDTLRPGMYAVVKLTLGTLDDAVVVPSIAVVDRVAPDASMQSGIFVVRDGLAHFTPVTVTGSSGDRSAVTPLEAGAAVVTRGQSSLRDGAPVRVVVPENAPKESP